MSTARLASRVLWRFRYDLAVILLVAAVMSIGVDYAGLQPLSGVVPLTGIVVSIFIAFRNRNAYTRWWEARTLWSGIVINGRSLNYALKAYEDGNPSMAAITDRMRRREVRYAWTLAANMHDAPPSPDLAGLTPEDPPDCTPADLLSRQACDIRELSTMDMIDRQARRVLITINSAQVNAAVGLERIKQQPIPRFYAAFTRTLAWLFAVIVCIRLDGDGHRSVVGILLGIIIMTLIIVAERLGALLEEPMSDDIFGLPLERFCATLTRDLSA